MKPARWPRETSADGRLLWIDPEGLYGHARLAEMPAMLERGDVLVLNDAATLPASLEGVTDLGKVEVRLAGFKGRNRWTAALLGEGDWRTPTESRLEPPRLRPGDRIVFGPDLVAVVEALSPVSPRLVDLCFSGDETGFFLALYRLGRPIQYAHLSGPLKLWHVQTPYASRPWAFELPSAGRPLRWELLELLQAKGISLAMVTHAAGLSATGDARIDENLPMPERFEIPETTVKTVASARSGGGRVIAVGTSVVRALEGRASLGGLEPGTGVTDLRIRPGFTPRVVDGILTGFHEPASSHFELLQAFASKALLLKAYSDAENAGYWSHEFGDSSLILKKVSRFHTKRTALSEGASRVGDTPSRDRLPPRGRPMSSPSPRPT